MRFFTVIGIAAAVAIPASVQAKTDPVPSPLIDALDKCLAITADAERLACTDLAARRLIEASRRREVVVVDRDEMRKTRRSLFGFTLPRIGLFGGDGPDKAEEVDRVEAKVTRVVQLDSGKLALTMEDGARWNTTEGWVGRAPRAGDTMVIKRASLGSYFVSIKGQRSVRAMRVG